MIAAGWAMRGAAWVGAGLNAIEDLSGIGVADDIVVIPALVALDRYGAATVAAGRAIQLAGETPEVSPATSERAAAAPADNAVLSESNEGGREKLKAKDRRRLQREEAEQKRAQQRGGEPEHGGDGPPRTNTAQNKQFDYLTKGLTEAERRYVHDEITKRGVGKEAIQELVEEVLRSRK